MWELFFVDISVKVSDVHSAATLRDYGRAIKGFSSAFSHPLPKVLKSILVLYAISNTHHVPELLPGSGCQAGSPP